ncbi:penicillin-binding protein [Paenibacillus sp. CC-CFT747]|nr:penicillin-binding protein [Paenibacillus sp. CC-CFT747]
MFKDKLKRGLAHFRRPFYRKSGLFLLLTIKWLVIVGIISGFLGAGVAFGYVSALVKDDPVRSEEYIRKEMQDDAQTGFVYFNDGTKLGQLRTDEDRRLATHSEIPETLRHAVIAIEDANFYEHHGVSVSGFLRAAKEKLLNEPIQTGGSTLTQQLARRVFLSLDKEMSRKFKELLLSFRLERYMSKDEILTAYLNKVPYGNGATGYNLYGIKAAAKGIFNVDDLNQLNLAQCAYLAGIPQQPSNFSTYNSKGIRDEDNIKKAIVREQQVLRSMRKENYITEEQLQEALNFDIASTFSEKQEKAYNTYPYLMIEAEEKTAEILLKVNNPKLDPEKDPEAYSAALKEMRITLRRGGYQIYTTIDKTIYDAMQAIAQNEKNFSPDDKVKGAEQVGAVLMENKTGAILGMIEGRNFENQVNHATRTFRQPGSTMKPIAAYVPALEKGAIQPAGVIDDVPILLKDGSKGYHIPENWDDDFHGLVTARKALNQSYNIPAIKLFLNDVGIKEAWTYAKKMGINTITKSDEVAQTGVIGGLSKGVSVSELTNAYATIANQGTFNDGYMISKIVDSQGKTVYEHERKPASVFSEETAYLMTDMLRTVITDGTAVSLKKDFKHYGQIPVVGKTGSTQDDADAWFMGYSPDITVGVWAGYEKPVNKLSNAGKNRAKSIWALVMDEAINKKPELFATKEFKRPANIVEMTVSNLSGKLPSDLVASSGHLVTDLFNKKFIPTEVDDVMIPMKYISYNGVNYVPHPETPEEFLHEKVVIKRKEPISSILGKISSVMDKVAKDRRRPLSFYVPLDADNDAPVDTDPRTDDGAAPSAPGGLVFTANGESGRLSFSASGSKDVVGYRLYRSVNRGPFQRVPGQIIEAGNETMFRNVPLAGASPPST